MDVELQEKSGYLLFVHSPYRALHIKEVVMYAPLLNERALAYGIQQGCQSISKKFGEDFGKTMDEANGPIVPDSKGIIFLRQEDDVSRI